MFTLFIDTHAEIITVALYDGYKLIEKTKESHYSHSVYLATMVSDILKENDLTVQDIKDIVAVNGPGSFTGLRIGLSHAKTMAYALNVPIYLISTLTSYLVSNDANSNKVCILEDNKGFYVSEFDRDNNVIVEEKYLDNINDFKDTYIISNKLDVAKVINYAKNNPSINAHLVRANYVKRIEVEK